MSETSQQNDPYMLRAQRLGAANGYPETYRRVVIEELALVASDANNIAANMSRQQEADIVAEYEFELNQLAGVMDFAGKINFASTAHQVLSDEQQLSLLDQPNAEVISVNLERLKAALKSTFVDSPIGVEFNAEDELLLEQMLVMTPEESQQKMAEERLAALSQEFSRIHDEKIHKLLDRSVRQEQRIAYLANEEERQLRGRESLRILRLVKDYAREGRFDAAKRAIATLNNRKQADRIHRILDDYLPREAKKMLDSDEQLTTVISFLLEYSSNPAAYLALITAIESELALGVEKLMQNQNFKAAQKTVETCTDEGKALILEALNASIFEHAIYLLKNDSQDEAERFVQKYGFGQDAIDKMLAAVLAYPKNA